MRAVGFRQPLPVSDPNSLIDFETDKPSPAGRDLLVEIKAVAVNPVDTKVRARAEVPAGQTRIPGWDAAGIVVGVGPDVTLFRTGDEVFYAGTITRPGTNAEFHLVDERIVGHKPRTLSFAEAAALPLTTITAWELLFDRLQIPRDAAGHDRTLLIVGGAGGVGSIAIQLARKLTSVTIIATASRLETVAWCKELGAHHVINHGQPMPAQLADLGFKSADYIASLTATEKHFDAMTQMIAPQGRFGLIDDPKSLDVTKLKSKSASLHWEAMFARSIYQTPDMIEQHKLLNETAALIEQGVLRSTLAEIMGTINAANLKKAHAMIESGTARGKIVLEGF
jgi:zinc-binding alcohol dehydrogenase family protein